jgi:glycerophosphoryl diester phosphodiesterase
LDILAAIGPTNVLLTAGDDLLMADLEAAKPGVPLGLSSSQCKQVLKGAYWGGIPAALHGRAFQVPPSYGPVPVTTERVIAAAHAANIEVHLWTINDARTAARWIARGVDGIMSDNPGELAWAVVDARHAQHGAIGHPLGR